MDPKTRIMKELKELQELAENVSLHFGINPVRNLCSGSQT